ncbi:MAG: hypothetical protein VKJ04_05730 [Vampirovibrionales bacterium]|nr:hypothetical protein [Vampirovibrionales bacterium]
MTINWSNWSQLISTYKSNKKNKCNPPAPPPPNCPSPNPSPTPNPTPTPTPNPTPTPTPNPTPTPTPNPTPTPTPVPTPTPYPTPTPTPTPECPPLHVTRELDGLNSTGVIGTQLTQGTGASQLAETNKLFLDQKFQVTGLLDEVNGANSTSAVISGDTGVLCADDMYVAGDPFVGGKKNNYEAVQITPDPGFYTMYEDGLENGRKITVNSHVDAINAEGNTAFTEYGMTVQDDAGQKYTGVLSGGQFTITQPDGTSKVLLPPSDQYVIGDPQDPVAKFYYADMPGGEDGTTEKRLVVDYIEKPTDNVVADLVSKNVPQAEAEKLRSTTQMSFGFRVPDGLGNTYRMSDGVGADEPLTESNGVKTYYDAHFSEGTCHYVDTVCTPPPPVAANERAKIWGDPHVIVADDKTETFESYNFSQVGLYNVVKDQGVTVNTNLYQPNNQGNVSMADQYGFTLGNGRTIKVDKNFNVEVGDGQGGVIAMEDGLTMDLGNGNSVSLNGSQLNVVTPEYDFKVTPDSWQNAKYLDLEMHSKSGGVFSDGVMPSGLLGETFDEDDIIEREPKLDVSAYVVGNLFDSNLTAIGQAPGTQMALSVDNATLSVADEPEEATSTAAAAQNAQTSTTSNQQTATASNTAASPPLDQQTILNWISQNRNNNAFGQFFNQLRGVLNQDSNANAFKTNFGRSRTRRGR